MGLVWNPEDVTEYVSALAGLSQEQADAILQMCGLNDAQRQLVLTELKLTQSTNARRIAQAAAVVGMNQITFATELGIDATERYSKAQLEAKLATSNFTMAQKQQIISILTGAKAAKGITGVFKGLGASLKIGLKTTLSSPLFWLSLFTTGLQLVSKAIEKSKKRVQELDDKLKEIRQTVLDTSNKFQSLKKTSDEVIPRFVELSKGVDKFGKNVKLTDDEYAEFLDLNNQIAQMFPEINMGMDSNGNAMLSLSYSADTLTSSLLSLVEAEREAANQEIAKQMPEELSSIQEINKTYEKEIDKLKDIKDEYGQVYNDIFNHELPTNVGRFSTKEAGLKAAEEFIAKAKELGMNGNVVGDDHQTINNGYTFEVEWDYSSVDFNADYITDQYNIALERLDKQINDFESKIQAKWNELNPIVGAWLHTDFMFNDLNDQMQEIIETMVSGLDFSELGLTTQEEVQAYISDNIIEPLFLAAPEVKDAFAQITDWREMLSSGEMSKADFAASVENVFEKMFETMQPDDITEFKRIFVSSFGAMGIAGEDFEEVLGGLISGWSNFTSAMGSEGDSLAGAWDKTFELFDSYTAKLERLAEFQSAVADGFKITAEEARKFAEVYPEILENATVASDGQIQLNEAVVSNFIRDKETELKGAVEAEVKKLEADKAVLTAKVESAKAQLELAKNVGEGEGKISKEVAEYRINTGNALTAALIEMGVEESKAHALAAAAMAENEEEFARVAKETFENMDENAAKAAYNMAHSIFVNASNSCKSISDIAKQAHDTAMAISAMGKGEVKGSGVSKFNGSDGTTTGGLSLDLYKGDFKGSDFNYEANTINLDDYVTQLQLDISSYNEAIKTIDSQIALLKSLGNTKLSNYAPGSKSKSSKKEVEAYVADIDAYREALERLAQTKEMVASIEREIENSDNLKEQILLERNLISAYEREQEALHNLNNQRRSTISAGVQSLRELGFAVEYNSNANRLWISNMEHLNDLTASSKGKYDTLQEATNAMRKETEELINSLTDLNKENQEGSQEWLDLKDSMAAANDEIQELLRQIVEEASASVDSIQNVYDTLHQAADEYAESGFITIDTLQSIIDLGPQYMAYLRDENDQLVINEENIRKVIAARTEQMAIESALSYIEALRIAQQQGNLETLNELLYATEAATESTWGFVYASLAALGLNGEQYQAALHNINAIRALSENAITNIGNTANKVSDELKDMQTGLNDILDYVMDMLKHRVEQQISALEDMKDAYSEIIDQKKESLELSREEDKRQKTMASKLKEIAKIQAQIDALSLDDSREAQAERAKLMEELAGLQEDLAEDQADAAVDAHTNALDKMEESYHDEKDKEIAILEESISSQEKIYQMAISYIQENWDTLYSELISWNTEYGSALNSEITSAWENCLAAAQRYGDYVSALNNIGSDIEASQNSGSNTVVGKPNYGNSYSDTDMVHAIIKEMYANSRAHGSASRDQQAYLSRRNKYLGETVLAQYGVIAKRGNDGVWYVGQVGGELLYEKYKRYIYHTGGIVGGGDVKSNEQIALLKDREWVLSEEMVKNLQAQMSQIRLLGEAFRDLRGYEGKGIQGSGLDTITKETISNVTNNDNRPVEITIGDTIIHGGDQKTVTQHMEVSRDTVNQIARILGIRR